MKTTMNAALAIMLPLMAGCRSYDTNVVRSGLFKDDLNEMFKAYDKIKEGVTTRSELKELGFDLNYPNVRHVQGTEAMKVMLGENYFQAAYNVQSKIEDFVKYLNDYSMVVIPYKNLLKVEDRFYFSTRTENLTGPDAELYLVFKGDMVIYRAKNYREVEEKRSNHAFLQGIFPWLKLIREAKSVI